jgi:hypothetical protein
MTDDRWTHRALDAAAAGHDIEASLGAFMQHMHNEMEHGSGTRAPQAVSAAALAAVPDLAKAVQAAPRAEGEHPPVVVDPHPYGQFAPAQR